MSAPPTSAMPPSGDPRWSAWCRPLLRLLAADGPYTLRQLRARRKELGLSVEFVTNSVAWLDLEGKIEYGPDGWAAVETSVVEVIVDPPLPTAPPPETRTCGRCGEEFVPKPKARGRKDRCERCRRWATARRSHERKCDAWARRVQARR